MEGKGDFTQKGIRFKVVYHQGKMQESELADNEQGSCKFPLSETSAQVLVICSFADGSSYQGSLVDDLYDGNGTFLFSDGTKYVGNFKSGEFFGEGSLTYTDGTSFSGSFDSGQPSGEGTLTNTKGMSYAGSFQNGKFNGEDRSVPPVPVLV